MSEALDRLTRALADRYRIERELGAGGMATVYLAEDLKHNRNVAIKVLKPELAAVLGAERFVQEIKTTAGLSHPHILPLFDSGEASGFLYYVMPYVEGETLREKLNRETQLGIDEAVKIATEVADALDYAHQHGVIHRDIKPENILLHNGRPMVMDFGIALAVSAAAGGRMTETGLSLGTPHYMSPEQATADKDLTGRSDVYSLGAVLYEMLTGDPPHTAASAQAIIMKIVTEEAAPVTMARKSVPPHVAAAVAKALEKLPADRFSSAAEFSQALHTTSFTYGTTGPTTSVRRTVISRTGWAGWIVAGVLAAGMGWMLLRGRDVAHAPSYAFAIETLGEDVVEPVVAEDGTVVLERDDEIRIRRSAALESVVLHRGDGTTGIALSPDGQWIAFTTLREERTELHRMPVTGGVPVSLLSGTPALIWSSPVWGDDGWIYFEGQNFVGRVSEDGGAVDTVLASGHFHPLDGLPGGRGLLLAAIDASSVIALNLTNGDTVTVAPGGVSARWSNTGHVLYVGDEGVLHAVPFDLRAFATTGSPHVVLDGVAPGSPFDLSGSGTLVYNAGVQGARRFSRAEYWWVGLDGTTSRIPIETVEGHTDGALAPDASRIAYIRGGQVHVFDLDLGTDRRVGEGNHDPLWSPDGRRIAFRNDQRGAVMVVASDGGDDPRVLSDLRATSPIQWVSDGTILLGSLSGDVRAVDDDPATDTPPRDLFVASWVEQSPAISPDRRWIAYESDEDGVGRAYVRSWPDLSGKTLVSGSDTLADEHRDLFWAPSSRTLHYLTVSGTVIAATLDIGNGVEVATRSVVTRLPGTMRVQDMDRRGNRFLVVRSAGDADQPNAEPQPNRLVVITNWFDELRRRVGERP